MIWSEYRMVPLSWHIEKGYDEDYCWNCMDSNYEECNISIPIIIDEWGYEEVKYK